MDARELQDRLEAIRSRVEKAEDVDRLRERDVPLSSLEESRIRDELRINAAADLRFLLDLVGDLAPFANRDARFTAAILRKVPPQHGGLERWELTPAGKAEAAKEIAAPVTFPDHIDRHGAGFWRDRSE